MKNLIFLIAVLFFGSTVFALGGIDKHLPLEKEKTELSQKLNGSGLCFTPNRGQVAGKDGKLCPDILYTGGGGGADIYLRKTGISYVDSNMSEVIHTIDEQVEELIKTGTIIEADERQKKDELMQKESIKIHRVDMDFEGANPNITTVNENELDGYNNYYYAHCPDGVLNVKQYNKVTYKNIYNNIDVSYYASTSLSTGGDKQNGIKYDLIVQPHANPGQIKLHWKGAESIHINHEGHLVIKASVNEFTESIPKVYQIIQGNVIDVPTKYILTRLSAGETIINFSFSIFNSSFPLVVDPWVTYYGGTGDDIGTSIACDNTGNVYLAGHTWSPNAGSVIATAGAHQTALSTVFFTDAFLVKFNSATGARTWATYYGGTGSDIGSSVACDNTGSVYLAGNTPSPNAGSVMAVAPGFQTVLGGGYDAFLVKFNSATGARIWATYYGGTGNDMGYSVACDNTGNVYLAGDTTSPNAGNVIAIAPGFQTFLGGVRDAFLVKFDATGARTWATYYGGTAGEIGYSVACDNTGNVHLAGFTDSPNAGNVIATAGGFQTVYGGSYDAFLVKFNSATGARTWATYYGGTGSDQSYSVACDNTGNVCLAGMTSSPNTGNAIATAGAHQTALSIGFLADAFLVKFNSATGARIWATYYGSALPELTSRGCLAIDGNNNVYLYMEVEDTLGPALDPCVYQPNHAGGIEDQMIVKFNPAGQKLCATYFGGTGYEDLDYGGGIAVSGNLLFICTGNNGGGYPVTAGAHQTVSGGRFDAVLASLCINICEGKTSLGLGFTAVTSVCANTPITFTPTISYSCDTTGYKYHWVFTNGTPATSDSMKPTVSFNGVGTHDVKLVVTTLCKKDSITQLNYITTTQCVVCNLVGQFTKGTSSCTGCGCKQWIMVTATGGTSPYSYFWPDGYDKRYKNQLCPGNYTVNIKDKNGCSVNVNLSAP